MGKYLLAFGLLLLAGQAHAGWQFKGKDSAFAPGGVYPALTVSGPFSLVFRCETRGDILMYYGIPLDMDSSWDGLVESARLKVRVDDLPPDEYRMTLDEADGRVQFVADVGKDLIEQIIKSKKRIALAIGLESNPALLENSFSTKGAGQVLEEMIKRCFVQ